MKRTIRGISIFSLLCALSWPANSQLQFPAESVLASGTWHRIAVAEAGVYKIDHAFITGQLGLSPASVDARQIRIYGNRGGALPQKIDSNLTTDLQEIHAWRSGLDDGTFNQGDFILFYAEGPDRWYLNDNDRYFMVRNIYDQRNHYFIRIGGGNAATIATEPSLPQADLEVSTSDERVRREIDRVNLLGKFQPPGSGKRWFGDEFSATREKTYTLEVPDVVTGSEVRLEVDFAGRSGVQSNVYADAGGQVFSQFISHVNLGNVEDDYARIGRISGAYLAAGDAQSITIRYPAVAGSTSSGWLDFIQVEAPRQLIFRAPSVTFRNIESQYHTSARYTISNAGAGTVVWDITDPLTPVQRLTGSGGNTISFAALTGARVREYLAFNPNGNFARPEYVDQVPNQNLHGITGADLVIIYHPDFEEAAMRLAEHRRTHSGYRVQAVPIQQVYNEFSGGSVDATAIRNLAVMLKNRDPEFRFLLLFGDGTYDMRHLNQDIENDNYIPVYETNESLDPIRSFPSDDYFAL
ncbi:MAG: C25 family cysteine peptidase, partial [Saprospiraceae bacterium]|nr:C25 family cysteine peptidase [Saprospiraceae bacterium]